MVEPRQQRSVEVLAGAGFGWLLLDTEPAANDVPMVLSQLQAAAAGTAHPIVRPPWNDAVMIKRSLDIELGCVFTAVGADIGILARGAEQLASRFKNRST